MEGFNQNNIWRLRLARYFQKALGCAELSPIYLESVRLMSLFKEFEERVTKVCVLGRYKTGKTSFINALCGTDVLPMDDTPCTCRAHSVEYGAIAKAVLYFQTPFPMNYRESLPSDIIDYLKWHNYGRNPYGKDIQIPALEYSFENSLCFIKYPEPSENIFFSHDGYGNFLHQYIQEHSAFNNFIFFFPSEFLEKRITIADTPGYNDDHLQSQKILQVSQNSDIVLYILDSIKSFTMEERNFIEKVVNICGVKISGMIVNRMDLVSRRMQEKYSKYCRVKVQEYFSDDAIFFISSKKALDACKENNDELLQQSGIPKVKEFIEQLAVRKERERFIAFSKALKDVISNDMMPSINMEITKTFGENRSEKIGNLIFISTELKSIVAGLKKLIDEIECKITNETK